MTMTKLMVGVMLVAGMVAQAQAGGHCKFACEANGPSFKNCSPAQISALENVCETPESDGGRGAVTTTTTTISMGPESTTTTTLDQRCEPAPSDINCRHYNRLHTKGFNCDVRVNGKRGVCKGYRTRRDGFVVATGCSIVVY